MNQDLPQFEDPALKQAIGRAFPKERASEALRGRVDDLLRGGVPTRQRAFWARPSVWAMAASLMIVISLAVWFFQRDSSPPIGQETLVALVQRHDQCCASPTHYDRRFSQASFAAMGKAMSSQLHAPVLAADLRRDGWTFTGPAICRVGKQSAAHLIFRRGAQEISVFSLPKQQLANGGMWSTQLDGHLLAGFEKSGTIYCMVGRCPHGQLQTKDLRHLLEGHESDMVSATGNQVALGASLLH